VQATVRSFAPDTRAGTVLLDDGQELPYRPGAVDPAVRLLRFGQRVRVRVVGSGAQRRVAHLTLATLAETLAEGSAGSR
jgi:hypothetical protein